ncbi:MAG: discoidin domain-containing protein [Planctomycetota bacterium]|jgi:hypothetical protein|nr:discoidin domain-containing protein [Planctomycetota bacterium]
MRTIALLVLFLVTPVALPGVELPDRAAKALDLYRELQEEQSEELADLEAKHAEDLARARGRVLSELKRSLGRRATVPEQVAVYQQVLRIERNDPEARDFFAALGTLEAEIERLDTRQLSVDLLGPRPAEGRPVMETLPDAAIASSSTWGPPLVATSARYSSKNSWSANVVDAEPWLQVDLGSAQEIVAVGTRARGDSPQMVTVYRVAFSRDGVEWVSPNDAKGQPLRLPGNTDATQEVRHDFPKPVRARMVRFYPLEHSGYRSMRVEIYIR